MANNHYCQFGGGVCGLHRKCESCRYYVNGACKHDGTNTDEDCSWFSCKHSNDCLDDRDESPYESEDEKYYDDGQSI